MNLEHCTAEPNLRRPIDPVPQETDAPWFTRSGGPD
jgi:hypothetical protein